MQRIFTWGLATTKNYLLLVYHVRVVKPFRISHIILRPLSRENLTLSHVNNKGTDQSAHQASLIGAFVICSLESIIAKQLNSVHSKLQASIEQADFSKMWLEILKKRDAAHIADFTGLSYFSGFSSGLKSLVLISHDYLSQSKFVPLPRDRAAMCSRPALKQQKKFCFVSKQACCIRSEG